MIRRCRARCDGCQCTLIDGHKERGLTHTFHKKLYDGKIMRFNVRTIVGFDKPIHPDFDGFDAS